MEIRKTEWLKHVRTVRQEGWTVTLKQRMPDGRVVPRHDLRFLSEGCHTMMGRKRLEHLHRCLDVVRDENVPGDLIETGVWRGGGTIFMRGYLMAHGITDRSVWVADSFEGLPKPTLAADEGFDFSKERFPSLAVGIDEVRELFARYDLLDSQVRFLKGWFKNTLPNAPIRALALLRLDGDLYESTMDALDALYSKVSPGGFVVVDDYKAVPPCERAVHDFRQKHSIDSPIELIDSMAAFWRVPKAA
ncbi:MAG: TylF/MycF/NovP-related O-methyltransferase [Polyangiaceae bacterium]